MNISKRKSEIIRALQCTLFVLNFVIKMAWDIKVYIICVVIHFIVKDYFLKLIKKVAYYV